MKILLCNDFLNDGGTETVLQTLVERLVRDGHDITLLASPRSDDEIKGTVYTKVHYIRMRLPKKTGKIYSPAVFFNLVSRKFHRLIGFIRLSFHKYDVCISMKEGVHIRDCGYIRAKKRILWIHCDLRVYPWFIITIFHSYQRARKFIEKKYDTAVCVSETTRDGYLETIGDTHNIRVLYNPIDWKQIRALSEEECSIHKNPERPLIIAVGRLAEVKNFMTLLKACDRIKDKFPFDLWILGDGPDREMLEEYIRLNDLTFVKLLGYINNPFPLMKQGDLFVSTSVSESYGLAIQEALILGVPVVAVNCPGVAESLDTRFGVLIDNSVEKLSETILDMLSTPSKLNTYRVRISEQYPVSSLYEDRLDKICELLVETDEII